MNALEDGGWTVTATDGMPRTYSGANQIAYLELVSPNKDAVDAQFLGNANEATIEATQAREHGYLAVAISNAIVFSHPNGAIDLSPQVVASLRDLLSR